MENSIIFSAKKTVIPAFMNVNPSTPMDWIEKYALQKNNLPIPVYIRVKRAVDLALVLLSSPVWLPVMLVIMAAIKISSPNDPVFFVQKRTGKNGQRFSMIKFRTMVVDSEAQKKDLQALNVLKWPDFKIPDDPRITPIGHFLRRTSLDELPQLLNILLGQMSLVGPRPDFFLTRDLRPVAYRAARRPAWPDRPLADFRTGCLRIRRAPSPGYYLHQPALPAAGYRDPGAHHWRSDQRKRVLLMPVKLGYIVSRFPHLSETFILREMVALEDRGWSIALYPLIVQSQPVVHPEAQAWLGRVKEISFLAAEVWRANLSVFLRQPGRYIRTWARMLWYNRSSPAFLARACILFPKAVWMSVQMKAEGVQHVHAHYATHPSLAAWIIHQLSGLPYSLTIHAHDIFVQRAMLAPKLSDAAFIVSISAYNREFIARKVGEWVRAKTHLVHCGVPVERYALKTTAWSGQEVFKLINIGSLQPYKGQEFLLLACKNLVDRGIPLQCDLIGAGELRPRLEQIIRQAGLEAVVHLRGALTQAEVALCLAEADCYVQPSVVTPSGKMEGIPLALMEAMACGLPVVASDLSGIPELVVPGVSGYLVPPGDASALADTLASIYANPGPAGQIACSGRELVRREFNLATQVDRLIALFEPAPGLSPQPSFSSER